MGRIINKIKSARYIHFNRTGVIEESYHNNTNQCVPGDVASVSSSRQIGEESNNSTSFRAASSSSMNMNELGHASFTGQDNEFNNSSHSNNTSSHSTKKHKRHSFRRQMKKLSSFRRNNNNSSKKNVTDHPLLAANGGNSGTTISVPTTGGSSNTITGVNGNQESSFRSLTLSSPPTAEEAAQPDEDDEAAFDEAKIVQRFGGGLQGVRPDHDHDPHEEMDYHQQHQHHHHHHQHHNNHHQYHQHHQHRHSQSDGSIMSEETDEEEDEDGGQDLDRAIVRLDGIEVYAVISALTCATSISCFDNFQPTQFVTILEQRAVFTFVADLCYYISGGLGMMTGLHATLIFSLVTMYGRTALGVDRDDAFNDFFASTGAARYSGFRSFKTSLDCFMIQLCFLIEKKCVLTPFRPFVLCGVGYFAYHVMHKESESVANAAGVIYAPPKTTPVLEDEEEPEDYEEIPDPEPIDQEQEGEAKHETDRDHTDKTAPSTSSTGGNPGSGSGKGWDAVRKSLNGNSASTSGTGGDNPGSGSSMLRDAVRKSITANAASTKGWNAVAKSISSNAAPNKRRRESLRKPGLSTRSFGIDTRSSSVTTTGTGASTIRKTSSKGSLSSINISDDSVSEDSDDEEDVVAVRGLNTRTSTSTSGGLNNRTSTSTSGSSGGSRRGQLRPSLSSRPSSGSRPSSNGGGPRPGRRRSTAGSSGVKKMGLSTRSFGINLAAQAAEVDSDDSSD